MIKNSSAVTINEFVGKIIAGSGEGLLTVGLEYGLQRGWLETQDAANPEQNVLRKHAARMIHNFLRLELKEAEEIDTAPAYVLQDLFDCRVCAGHIIQVYVKGIMDSIVLPDGKMIFAAEEVISKEEAEASEIEDLVEKKFGGSLPAFVAAFTKHQNVSEKELDELQRMIDRIRRGDS